MSDDGQPRNWQSLHALASARSGTATPGTWKVTAPENLFSGPAAAT